MMDTTDPWQTARQAADLVGDRLGEHDALIVLGSGWRDVVDRVGERNGELAVTDVPGFPPPTVLGHGGSLVSLTVGPTRVLALTGRVHLYEGHPPSTVVHGVRTAILAGCRSVVLTNAAGSLAPELTVGRPVLITDHLNLTGQSSLTGPPPPDPWSLRFVDLTEAYSARLRAIATEVDPDVGEGVYAGLGGPQFETPAEIRMLRSLGADLVGMSTVLETIAARHLGAEVLAVSLVTNQAAGISGAPLDHHEVLEAGRAALERVAALFAGVLPRL
ncbi:MAG: purine-nucleoside phosphorylase [Acidimicrobiales bacterium]|nr:purine-nucleoside phosphorylase [Acidimicrobiales bacterium]